jgi:antitoxin FitA
MLALEVPVAQILVRNLDETTKAGLQRRARRNGRSMEAEVREILRGAVLNRKKPQGGLGSEIVALFSGQGIGLEKPIEELRGFTVEPVDFDK